LLVKLTSQKTYATEREDADQHILDDSEDDCFRSTNSSVLCWLVSVQHFIPGSGMREIGFAKAYNSNQPPNSTEALGAFRY
jgi:hypothetical protein